MNVKEARKLYEGKYFYEIIKPMSGRFAGLIQLAGPFDNIRYVNEDARSTKTFSTDASPAPKIKFVQVVDGKIVASFQENEILVTDRVL